MAPAHQYGPAHVYPVPSQSMSYVPIDQYSFRNTPMSSTASTAPPLPSGTFSIDQPAHQNLRAMDATANAYSYANANEHTHPTSTYQQSMLDGQVAHMPASWRDFTGNVINNLEPQDFMMPANALVQLGNRQNHDPTPPMINANVFTNSSSIPTTSFDGPQSQQWPIFLFEGQPAAQ